MNITRTNNQPNFKSRINCGDEVQEALVKTGVYEQVAKQGEDNVFHNIFYQSKGPNAGKFYFSTGDAITGSTPMALFLTTFDNIVELAKKNVEAVGFLNKYHIGNRNSQFSGNMSADEIIALGLNLDKKA